MKGGRAVPLAVPYLSELERANVLRAIDSTWISSSGEFLEEFESTFAQVAGTTDSLAVTNGTVALHLALLALGVGPGDEVIVPSLTYIATANAVRYVGAEPVFVDVEEDTWCLDPGRIEEVTTDRTVGVISVDLYGHPADYDRLLEITHRRGLWLVEDAAEAPYGTYKGRPVGSFGAASTFSFYGNKVLTSGEGGAVASSDGTLVERMRLIRGQGMDPHRRYFFPVVGHNFRMTNVAAAILCAQLSRAEEILRNRQAVYEWYSQRLARVPGIGLQPVAPWARVSPWLFSITVDEDFPLSRDGLINALSAEAVETRPFFLPLHTLPPYVGSRTGEMLVTERVAAAGVNLPTHPGMHEDDVDRVCDLIASWSSV